MAVPWPVYFAIRLSVRMLNEQTMARLYAAPKILNLEGGTRDWMSGRYLESGVDVFFMFDTFAIFLLPLFII